MISSSNGTVSDATARRALASPPSRPPLGAALDRAVARGEDRQTYAKRMGNVPGTVFRSVWNVQRSITMLSSRVLADSDVAIRQDRRYQMMMRHDPDVMSPLQQRQKAVALLPWSIVPEDQTDSEQVARAEQTERIIRRHMRKQTEFLDKAGDALWYGPSAQNVVYRRVLDDGAEMFAPTDWYPLHSDSLVFQDDGTLGMMVNARWPGETVQARRGRAVIFSSSQRKAVVLHTYNRTAPDYEGDAEEARYLYSGRGLRDTCYYPWVQKMTALELWMRFIERYSLGTRVGYFPSGNPQAQAVIEEIVDNVIGDAGVSIPWEQGLSKDEQPWQIDVLDRAGSANDARVFLDLIEGYLAGQMKELIIGQTATTEATATGLGSDVGTRHAETFQRLIQHDALSLGDSLTHELVGPLVELNYGILPYGLRWQFAVEDVDSEKWMQGAKMAHEMGVPISHQQIYDHIGSDVPSSDEATTTPPGAGGVFGEFDAAFDRFRRAL